LIAARRSHSAVEVEDFEAAIDRFEENKTNFLFMFEIFVFCRVIGGMERKNRVLSVEEKTIVAYHESG